MPYLDYTNEPEPEPEFDAYTGAAFPAPTQTEFDAYTGAALPAPAPSFTAGNKGLIPALMGKYPSVRDAFTGKGLARASQEKAHQKKRQQAALPEGSPPRNPWAGMSEEQIQSRTDELLSQGRPSPAPPGNPWAGLSDAQIQSRTNELLNQGRPPPTPRQALGQRGFSRLEQDFSAGDGSRPADIYYKEDADAGTTRYEIPGTTGFAEFQGQRKGGGSFSVMPGLSAADKQRYAELKARDQRESERREYRDFANEVLSQYGDYPAVAMEILKQAEASMSTRASTEQAGLQAARESQQAQREAMEDRRRWEAEYGLEVAETKMDAVTKDRQWAMDTLKEIPVMSDKEALELDENFKYETPTGETVVDEKAFQETFNVRPLKANEPPMVGQLYFNEAEGRYELATQEGMRPLGSRLEVYRYRHAQLQRQQQRRLGQ